MFIKNVQNKGATSVFNEQAYRETQQWEKEIFLRLMSNRNSWRVLAVWPGTGEELPIMAHQIGEKGELVIIDTNTAVLEQIEQNKQKGLYKTRSTQDLRFDGAYAWNAKVQALVRTQTFDGFTLDFEDDYFDAIWCPLSGQPYSKIAPTILIDEFNRAVRPGGFIVVCQDNTVVA